MHEALAARCENATEVPNVLLVGDCPRGADKFALQYYTDLVKKKPTTPIICKRFMANWTRHGAAAGPLRNQAMLDYAKQHCGVVEVVAFPLRSGLSKGTHDCIARAVKLGVTVTILEQP